MMDLVDRAALYSRAAHSAVGQRIKYTGDPYWQHCADVADHVQSVTHEQEVIAAALLHDVLENTLVTQDDIEREFGSGVAGYVFELTNQFTDPQHGNRSFRVALENERLSRTHPNTQTIKYADLIVNTSTIWHRDPGFASIYLAEKRSLLGIMVHGDHELYGKARRVLDESERLHRGPMPGSTLPNSKATPNE